MSFDIPEDHELSYFANLSQSLSSRAMSFDIDGKDTFVNLPLSQSLSSRAMSFDRDVQVAENEATRVSIPFEQGDVFRHNSINLSYLKKKCLNPFRAGRCLSTQHF